MSMYLASRQPLFLSRSILHMCRPRRAPSAIYIVLCLDMGPLLCLPPPGMLKTGLVAELRLKLFDKVNKLCKWTSLFIVT
jgi:hypothetical protein